MEYPGALHHVLARGDRREPIFLNDDDREAFLSMVGGMCRRTGMVVLAYVLMSNHDHLVLETPEANLVDGMRWLQNSFTRRFNVRHGLWGHVFGGRCKALVIDPEEGYFRRVVDYVHLNPCRAGLVSASGDLTAYPWSSLKAYSIAPRHRPAWLMVDRLFRVMSLTDSASGRAAYLRRLASVAGEQGASAGVVTPGTMPEQSLHSTVRRGWYFGRDSFRDELLHRLKDGTGAGVSDRAMGTTEARNESAALRQLVA